MATFADAVTEQARLQRSYVGVTVRMVPAASAGTYALEIHDVRPSEAKTAGQLALTHPRAWSAGQSSVVTTQAIWP